MRRLLPATAMLLLALPCFAQQDHEVEVSWGRAFREDVGSQESGGNAPAAGLAWRPPLGHGWRLEVALGGTRGLSRDIEHSTRKLDASWLQVGIVTPPATRGIASLRAFLRAGMSRLEQTETFCYWPECTETTSSDTVPSAGLGVRLDLALSKRLALGLQVAWISHTSSSGIDTPSLVTAGLGLTARLGAQRQPSGPNTP
jgi:hypothetical protein